MPPEIALLLCILFVLYLLWSDSRRKAKVSGGLWIPLMWMIAMGSRSVYQWLDISATEIEINYMEGSPIDRSIFIFLIVLGIAVLFKRNVYLAQVLKNNIWLILLLFFSGVSILWSDFPLISFKRWVMGIGYFIMALVVLTEINPIEAVKIILKRYTYALIPLSIVLIKYYPYIGRSYNPWTGLAENIGVTTNKNMLGQLCLVCGLFFVWQFVSIWSRKNISFDKREGLINVFFLVMISWLLIIANSATSTVSLIIGIFILTCLSFIKRNVKYVEVYIFVGVAILVFFQLSTDIIGIIIPTLGRDATLSSRTELWDDVMNMSINSLIGTGYESFWLGARLEELWGKYWWRPNQAHNGYLETYLNLGLIGLFLLAAIMISTLRKISKRLLVEFEHGKFQMAFMIIFLAYNITENAFKGTMWFMFLVIALEVPKRNQMFNSTISNRR